eukprot:SAG31_NODE_5118_length_2730_cov_6.394147_2_plen_77_part_00
MCLCARQSQPTICVIIVATFATADGMTPLDRMLSNRVAADELRRLGGDKRGPVAGTAVPDWGAEEFSCSGGVGEMA